MKQWAFYRGTKYYFTTNDISTAEQLVNIFFDGMKDSANENKWPEVYLALLLVTIDRCEKRFRDFLLDEPELASRLRKETSDSAVEDQKQETFSEVLREIAEKNNEWLSGDKPIESGMGLEGGLEIEGFETERYDFEEDQTTKLSANLSVLGDALEDNEFWKRRRGEN